MQKLEKSLLNHAMVSPQPRVCVFLWPAEKAGNCPRNDPLGAVFRGAGLGGRLVAGPATG